MTNASLLGSSTPTASTSLLTVTFVHVGSARRHVDVVQVTRDFIGIWWPTAGYYEVNPKTGRIRGGKRYASWTMDASDLVRCKALLVETRPKHLRPELPEK
jgi:hypothetical protein